MYAAEIFIAISLAGILQSQTFWKADHTCLYFYYLKLCKDKTEVALKMEDDSKPAWLPFKTKPSIGTDVTQKLLVIGEHLLDIDQSKKQ